MGTLVCFHAHPDDEAIATGGSMARAHVEGHRVVLVLATDGAHGETPPDLEPGETLAERRRKETDASAAALGVDRVEFLGYTDSGMTGWDSNDHHESFWRADVDDAARRLADLLIAERADVLTIYDWHGGYGHPDHIQVHRVGARAADLACTEVPGLRVVESTMNRDEMRRFVRQARESGLSFDEEGVVDDEFDPDGPMDDGNPMGTPAAEITLCVEVFDHLPAKRAALEAHRSQIAENSFFLQMPQEVFRDSFGREWFIEHDRDPGPRVGWLFDS